MAEWSGWWTTDDTGDGAASGYTQAQLTQIAKVLAACSGFEGVAPGLLNECNPTANGANTVAINTGGAVVDGKPYYNSASVDVTIASAVGGGNTRIDRIVLRAGWAAQTVRITRIAGTDAASPTAPALTQTPGTTYDISLCTVLVNTAGTVTVTDARTWADVGTSGVADAAITSAKLAAAVAAMLVTNGNSHNHLGGDGATLGGGSLGFEAVNTAAIIKAGILSNVLMAADSIDSDQYVDGSIDAVHLAADIVDDTKVGNRVPALTRRQGGSATNWSTPGTTTYTPTAVRMQTGRCEAAGAQLVINFPVAFSAYPLVLITSNVPSFPGAVFGASESLATITGLEAGVIITWLAIGPE